mmetsp:Transcript_23562/g.30134  ORF Transcript_23562/g.30134 Transcript_23562/m.30134 type:complete len:229 (-) Transcript_23562:58-744(-)
MRDNHSIASILTAALILLSVHGDQVRKQMATFRGPGVVECSKGECDFSIKSGLGCVDPCHTLHHHHMYDMTFGQVSEVSTDFQMSNPSNDNIIGGPCFHRNAKNIEAHFPDGYISIEEGCIAHCKGCTFAPIVTASGPGMLKCQNGRCTSYTTAHFDCGKGIEEASETSGSFHTVLSGDDTSYSFYGYEGINTRKPIKIRHGCNLECSGCSFQEDSNGPRYLRNDILH